MFSCADDSRNPRDYFNKISKQTQDFEIERLQNKFGPEEAKAADSHEQMESYEDGEFMIKNLVPHAHKHCFIEEEFGSDVDEEEPQQVAPTSNQSQVKDEDCMPTMAPYSCEIQVLDDG